MLRLQHLPQHLQQQSKDIARLVKQDAPRILGVEAQAFIQHNFKRQGFQARSLQKWAPRKTTDTRGRDLTRYRTNRRGRQGTLTSFGSSHK